MAVSQKVPGVYITELDKSEVTASVGSSLAGLVIASKKGPANRRVVITNERDYVSTFGNPVADENANKTLKYGYNTYAGLFHLRGGGALEVVRAAIADDKYAGVLISSATATPAAFTCGIPFNNNGYTEDKINDIYSIEAASTSAILNSSAATSANYGALIALNYPGSNTSSVAVTIEGFHWGCDWFYSYDEYSVVSGYTSATAFTSADYTNVLAARIVKLYVYDSVNGTTPVEVFYGTMTQETFGGNSIYLPDVVNGKSNAGIYVKILDQTKFTSAFNVACSGITSATSGTVLAGGASPTTFATSAKDGFYAYFDKEASQIFYLINAEGTSAGTSDKSTTMDAIITQRGDTLGFVQVGGDYSNAGSSATYKANVLADSGYGTSQYAKYQGYESFTDTYSARTIWIPNVCEAVRINALTDQVANPWDAPAGKTRGFLAGTDQKFAFSSGVNGEFYDANVNILKKFPGAGWCMWGQKTAQRKKSALDRINVRKTINVIKRSVATSLEEYVLDANNTAGVRLRIYNSLNDYLQGIVDAGGLLAATVVCDETNNTAQVIDNNQLAVSIILQPTKTIEFIMVNVIITRTGVSVTEALQA